MANIRAKLNYPIEDGSEVIFRSPLEYSNITGLTVSYISHNGHYTSKDFTFVDAHRNDVTHLSELFTQNAIVKVILDCTEGYAYIQNADTNAYLEDKFDNIEKLINDEISKLYIPNEVEVINNHNNDSKSHNDIRVELNNHTNTSSIHVTSGDKNMWNNKAGVEYVDDKFSELKSKIPTVSSWAKQETKPTYTASEVGAEPAGTVSKHNVSDVSHNDIRILINDIISRVNALANSDDATLDDMKEIVAYIKNNKSLIDSITSSKVNVSDIVNNLTTNVANKPLSAAQGVELIKLINDITVPSKLSQLINDKGYLLSFTETDPTVPNWAKQATKPTYTASEVGALSASEVNSALALKAPLASPTFTGTPKAPTATVGTNSTQIATTAFVTSAINAVSDNLGGFTPVIDEVSGQITGYKTTIGGADTVFPFSTGTVIQLSETPLSSFSINVSDFYDGDISRLTVDNFICDVKSVSLNTKANLNLSKNSSSKTNVTVSKDIVKSYDPETGIFEASVESLSVNAYKAAFIVYNTENFEWNHATSNSTAEFTFIPYLIIK